VTKCDTVMGVTHVLCVTLVTNIKVMCHSSTIKFVIGDLSVSDFNKVWWGEGGGQEGCQKLIPRPESKKIKLVFWQPILTVSCTGASSSSSSSLSCFPPRGGTEGPQNCTAPSNAVLNCSVLYLADLNRDFTVLAKSQK
jgi:hypothetical protein